MEDRITSAETAQRLGVKLETLYAYVSRGLLSRERAVGGRGSTFARAEVETLAASGGRARGADSRPFRFPSINTRVSLVTDDGLRYRGADAIALSETRTFEEVASWLWTGEWSGEPMRAPESTLETVRAAVGALPASVDLTSRMRVAVTAASAVDHLRFDTSPASVRHMARVAVAAMVDGLTGGPVNRRHDIATRLWRALAPGRRSPALRECVQAALVLLADHGLAASTVAARAAASARAHPYAVLSAGLGALDGPLHGAASTATHRLLDRVLTSGDVDRTLADYLRQDRPVPGIGAVAGHAADPRAVKLLHRLAEVPAAEPALEAVDSIVAALRPHGRAEANVELAIAALAIAARMPPEAGEVIFGVARSAGWTAHALEEYQERPLRWRGREVYSGPR